MKRPLVVLTLYFISGIILGHYFFLSIFYLVLISLTLLITAIFLFFFLKQDVSILLFLFSIILGVLYIEQRELSNQRLLAQVESLSELSPIELTGKVVESSIAAQKRVSLTVDRVRFFDRETQISFPGKIMVNLTPATNKPTYFYGDRIKAYGILRLAPQPSNPGEFDYQNYLVQDGIYGILKSWQAKDLQLVQLSKLSIYEHSLRFASKLKQYLININSATLPPLHAALLNGIVLGEKSELTDDIKDAFIRTGIFHLLVVSGSNVMLVSLIVFVLLKMFRIKRRFAAVVSIPLVILYALIAGYQPPVSRATIMSVLVLIGLAAKQDNDIINNLGIAALLALILNPLDVFNSSFQLSFLTVLSIILIYPILSSWYTFPRPLSGIQMVLYSSIAAFIGIVPLSAYYFNIIPLISPLTNLIAAPIVGAILPAGFLTGFVYPFSPAVAQFVANTNWLLLTTLIKIVKFLYFFPLSYFNVGTPSFWFILIYYVLLLGFIQFFRPTDSAPAYTSRKKWLFATISVILIIFLSASFTFWNRTLEMTFLNVGQGDSIFLHFPDGKTMLIDGGDSRFYDSGKHVLLPYFRRQGIERIDIVVLSHPHNDHVGGLVSVLNNFPVQAVVDSEQTQYDPECYPMFRDSIRQKNIRVLRAVRGETIPVYSGATVRVLYPLSGFLQTMQSPVNNNSIVLQIIYGKVTTLFTGDIELEAESDLVRMGTPLTAAVIKMPHHGSATSCDQSFLMKVHPNIAVISVGENNTFNLPAPGTVDALEQQNIKVYRTDRDGAIIIRTNGQSITVDKVRNNIE